MKRTVVRGLLIAALAILCGVGGDDAPAANATADATAGATAEPGAGGGAATPRPQAAPGRLIVKYRGSVAASRSASLDALHRRFQVRATAPLFHGAALRDLQHVYVLEVPRDVDPERAAAAFRRDPRVAYAQPDYLVFVDVVPNDPYFTSSGSWRQPDPDLWALRPDKLDMARAWDVTQGKGVVVAVVDTGVDSKHKEIAPNLWRNPREIANNRIDDDGNGYVDDVRGWSFVTCKELETIDRCRLPAVPGPAPEDDNGHGTHVAGTIAAVANNGRGIVGVAPQATIMPLKAFNRQGVGLTSEIAAALVYAARNGADVVNNSWGCGFCPDNPVFADAVRTLHGLGVVTVFAAGNSATDVRLRSPQNLHDPKPLVVGASNQLDQPTWFSCFGAAMDVVAPGGGLDFRDANVLSLRARDCALCTKRNRWLFLGGEYLRLQGTSMATPHVAGLAALLLAQRPSLTPDEVRQLLRASAADVGEAGFDLRTGAGRIDAARTLAAGPPLTVRIDAPADLTTAGSGPVPITGTAAGPDFDRYQLFYREDLGGAWQPLTSPSTAEVRGGELGRWDLAGLPLGWKALRLEATTKGGRRFEDVVTVGRQLRVRKVATGPAAAGSMRDPAVSGSLVVFEGDVQPDELRARLYLHDLESGTTRRLSEQLYGQPDPAISGNLIVWKDYHIPSAGPNDLFACRYDAATGACPVEEIPLGRASVGRFAVSGDRIAWSGVEVRGRDLIQHLSVYDTRTRTRRDLPPGGFWMDFDGDRLVVAKRPPGADNWELVLFDVAGGTEVQITRTPQDEVHPKIRGSQILFERPNPSTDEAPRTSEVVVYDLADARERVLMRDLPQGALGSASFTGSHVVWRQISDVLTMELPSLEVEAVVVGPLAVRADPRLSGDHLVWVNVTDFVRESGDLYTAELGELE